MLVSICEQNTQAEIFIFSYVSRNCVRPLFIRKYIFLGFVCVKKAHYEFSTFAIPAATRRITSQGGLDIPVRNMF